MAAKPGLPDIPAKWAGKCMECGGRVHVGEILRKHLGKWIHLACAIASRRDLIDEALEKWGLHAGYWTEKRAHADRACA